MADPYTDEELAKARRCIGLLPPPGEEVAARMIATLDARDATHRQEIAERDARIAELEEGLVRARLATFYSGAEIKVWLSSPQPLLDGAIANDLIAAGEAGKVLHLIDQLDDGVYL